MTIVFVCLLVTVLTPRKKADLSQAPELETQVQEKVQDAVGKALVENKIEVQKNKEKHRQVICRYFSLMSYYFWFFLVEFSTCRNE